MYFRFVTFHSLCFWPVIFITILDMNIISILGFSRAQFTFLEHIEMHHQHLDSLIWKTVANLPFQKLDIYRMDFLEVFYLRVVVAFFPNPPRSSGTETCVFCHQDKMRPFAYEGLSLLPTNDDETWSQNTKRTNTLVVLAKYVSCQMCCDTSDLPKAGTPKRRYNCHPKRTATGKTRRDISLGK